MAAMKAHYERRTGKAPTAEELFEEFRIIRRTVCVDGASSDEWTEYDYDIPKESEIESEVVKEIGLDGKKVKNVITGEQMDWGKMIQINPKGVTLLTTKLN